VGGVNPHPIELNRLEVGNTLFDNLFNLAFADENGYQSRNLLIGKVGALGDFLNHIGDGVLTAVCEEVQDSGLDGFVCLLNRGRLSIGGILTSEEVKFVVDEVYENRIVLYFFDGEQGVEVVALGELLRSVGSHSVISFHCWL